jgi:hypothetical protein
MALSVEPMAGEVASIAVRLDGGIELRCWRVDNDGRPVDPIELRQAVLEWLRAKIEQRPDPTLN